MQSLSISKCHFVFCTPIPDIAAVVRTHKLNIDGRKIYCILDCRGSYCGRLPFAVRRSKSERDGSIFLLTSCSDGSAVDARFEGCIVVGC
eukprot:scaffold248469_cov43-Cyclotella_meneghiniana.AAC.2